MRKTSMLWFAGGILLGSTLTTSAVVGAANPLNVAVSQIKLLVNGADKTPPGNTYNNGAAQVPLALNYQGTTYMPIRYISEALGQKVAWEGTTGTIQVGNQVITPGGSVPVLKQGQSAAPESNLPVTFSPQDTSVFASGDANIVRVAVAIQNDDTQKFSYSNYQTLFTGDHGEQYAATLYLPQGSTAEVQPRTTQIAYYYATVPKSERALNLQFQKVDFSSYPAQMKSWAAIPVEIPADDTPHSTPSVDYRATGMFDLGPYHVTLGPVESYSYKVSTTTQVYKMHVQTTKNQEANVFPNSSDLMFEVQDGLGQSVGQLKYAIGTATTNANPLLADGDQYLTYTIDWSRYATYGNKILVWELFGGGKRLISTYAVN
jgi:hypothetical protein